MSVATIGEAETPDVENSKKAGNVFQSSLELAKACKSTGTDKRVDINIFTNSGTGADSDKSLTLLEGMRTYFAAEDNCGRQQVVQLCLQAQLLSLWYLRNQT
jgi:hypothetical protein